MSTITSREEATEARAPAERGDSAAAHSSTRRRGAVTPGGLRLPLVFRGGPGSGMFARPAPRMQNIMAELMVGLWAPSSPPRVPLLAGSLAERSPERQQPKSVSKRERDSHQR